MQYPPDLSEEQVETLISDIKDWQLIHGSLLKIVQTDDNSTVLSRPVGVSIFPTLFPEELFHEALALQRSYNRLYTSIAEDEKWLHRTLDNLIEFDPLAKTLWGIYEEVKQQRKTQPLRLGIFRSDYMLHVNRSLHPQAAEEPQLKQVEFNTISVAGGAHGNKVSHMHKYLHHTGAFEPPQQNSPTSTTGTREITSSLLPPNNTIKTLCSGLATAHRAYGPPKSHGVAQTCVLFIVQPENFNIGDERPLEYALWEQDPPIPAYRIIFGHDVLEKTTLTQSGELLYHPTSRRTPLEVSVVYLRAGLDASEYDTSGRMARLHLERSYAIKCPSILSHMATFKKVQQALTLPGALQHFLPADEAAKIAKTFAPMYPLDESISGLRARKLALDPNTAVSYVLKPSREGGGHNIYGGDIPAFLAKIPPELWPGYVLMQKIVPPVLHNVLMSARGIYEGPVISELGVFGVCLWKLKGAKEQVQHGARTEIMEDLEPSWSFKTKDASVNEMSVVKGYGCFDSPSLVNIGQFASGC